MKIAAIALIALGVLGLVYGGFTYTRDVDRAKIGPLEIQVEDKEFVPVPLWAGVIAIAAGAGLLLFGIPGRKV
jgi:hypothetical protein